MVHEAVVSSVDSFFEGENGNQKEEQDSGEEGGEDLGQRVFFPVEDGLEVDFK